LPQIAQLNTDKVELSVKICVICGKKNQLLHFILPIYQFMNKGV